MNISLTPDNSLSLPPLDYNIVDDMKKLVPTLVFLS